MPEVVIINGKNYTVGIAADKKKEIIDMIGYNMGDDFAKYVDEYIGELEEKSNEEYWKAHTDEQAYEEELNEMNWLLDELRRLL